VTVSKGWLDIPDEQVDTEKIMQRVRARLASRDIAPLDEEDKTPEAIASALWRAMIGSSIDNQDVPIQGRDCDVVPRNYVIDWRVPILGPIHAAIRRVINAEIRRYVLPSLRKQSYLNRQVLRVLNDLFEENERLHQEIRKLREDQGEES